MDGQTTVQSADWQFGVRVTPTSPASEGGTGVKYVRIAAANVTQQALDHGIVLTYIKAGGSAPFTDRWSPLPYAYLDNTNDVQVNNIVSTAYLSGIEFDFFFTGTPRNSEIGTRTIQPLTFRYVVLSQAAAQAVKTAGVSTNDPDTVVRFLRSH